MAYNQLQTTWKPSPWGPIPDINSHRKWVLAEIVPREGETLRDTLLRGARQGLDHWGSEIGHLGDWGKGKPYWLVVLRPRSGPWEVGEAVVLLTCHSGSTTVEADFGTLDCDLTGKSSTIAFAQHFPLEEFTELAYTGPDGTSPIVKLE